MENNSDRTTVEKKKFEIIWNYLERVFQAISQQQLTVHSISTLDQLLLKRAIGRTDAVSALDSRETCPYLGVDFFFPPSFEIRVMVFVQPTSGKQRMLHGVMSGGERGADNLENSTKSWLCDVTELCRSQQLTG